jgi:hypothetical protein
MPAGDYYDALLDQQLQEDCAASFLEELGSSSLTVTTEYEVGPDLDDVPSSSFLPKPRRHNKREPNKSSEPASRRSSRSCRREEEQ